MAASSYTEFLQPLSAVSVRAPYNLYIVLCSAPGRTSSKEMQETLASFRRTWRPRGRHDADGSQNKQLENPAGSRLRTRTSCLFILAIYCSVRMTEWLIALIRCENAQGKQDQGKAGNRRRRRRRRHGLYPEIARERETERKQLNE